MKKLNYKNVLNFKSLTKNKGVTLIALIVTIIIVLILASVSVAIFSNSNIIKKSKFAGETYQNKINQEEKAMENYASTMNEYSIADAGRDETKETIKNNWSGEEHLTGETYLDGKPIYEKTYYISSLPNNTTKIYLIDIENIDSFWINTQKSIAIWPDKHMNNIPYLANDDTSNTWAISIGTNPNAIWIGCMADRSSLKAYVTINYTKTTDNGKSINVTELKAK